MKDRETNIDYKRYTLFVAIAYICSVAYNLAIIHSLGFSSSQVGGTIFYDFTNIDSLAVALFFIAALCITGEKKINKKKASNLELLAVILLTTASLFCTTLIMLNGFSSIGERLLFLLDHEVVLLMLFLAILATNFCLINANRLSPKPSKINHLELTFGTIIIAAFYLWGLGIGNDIITKKVIKKRVIFKDSTIANLDCGFVKIVDDQLFIYAKHRDEVWRGSILNKEVVFDVINIADDRWGKSRIITDQK